MKYVIAGLFAAAIPFAARADGQQKPPHPPRKPPQEAFDACANLRQGDACSITLRDQTIAGTCEAPPETTALACRPSKPPGPPPGGGSDRPPPPPPPK